MRTPCAVGTNDLSSDAQINPCGDESWIGFGVSYAPVYDDLFLFSWFPSAQYSSLLSVIKFVIGTRFIPDLSVYHIRENNQQRPESRKIAIHRCRTPPVPL
jgi:hypothetical protein